MSSVLAEYEEARVLLGTTPLAESVLASLNRTVHERLQTGGALIHAFVEQYELDDMVQKNTTLLFGRLLKKVRQLDACSLEVKLEWVVNLFCALTSAAEQWATEADLFEQPSHSKKERRKRRQQGSLCQEADVVQQIERVLTELQPILLPENERSLYLTGGALMIAPSIMSLLDGCRPKAAAWIYETFFSREMKGSLFSRLLLMVREWAKSPASLVLPSLEFEERLIVPFEKALGSFFHTFLAKVAPWILAVPKRTLATKILSFICYKLHTSSIEELLLTCLATSFESPSQPISPDVVYKIIDDEAFFTCLVSKCIPHPHYDPLAKGTGIIDMLLTGLQAVVSSGMSGSASGQIREVASYSLVRVRNFVLSKQFDHALTLCRASVMSSDVL